MKKKLTREQKEAYRKYIKAVEEAEAEHRAKQLKRKMDWEKQKFLFGD